MHVVAGAWNAGHDGGRRAPPRHFLSMLCRDDSVIRPHHQRRAPDPLPFLPVGALCVLSQGPDHHVTVESWTPTVIAFLQACRPAAARGTVTEERDRRIKRREWHRPGAQPPPGPCRPGGVG